MKSQNAAAARLNRLRLRLAGIDIEFLCQHRELMEYAAVHLGPLLVENGDAPHIRAVLEWHEGQPPTDPRSTFPRIPQLQRVDRDLYLGPGEAVWLRIDDARDLQLRFAWRRPHLEIHGVFFHRLSKRPLGDWARRVVYRARLGTLRRKWFTRLLYYLVYYPAFWWGEHVLRVHPAHAAAVAMGDRAVLLPGPSGVGKSTLTVALSALPGARMLSDTFVLHQGADLWAVPEPLLLDSWSRQWLGEDLGWLVPVANHRYALRRRGFVAPPTSATDRARAVAAIFPCRSPAPGVRPLSAAEGAARLEACNDIVNDLRRYRAVAAVLELIEPSDLPHARLRSLDALAAAVNWYELRLTSEQPRGEVVRQILQILDCDDPRHWCRQLAT